MKNPMDNTTRPQYKKSKKRMALSEETQKIFLEDAENSCYSSLYRLASLTGMRIGEVLGLQWDDINFNSGEIHITHTICYTSEKGQYLDTPKSSASRRTIPMEKDSEVYKLLKNQRKKQLNQRIKAGLSWTPIKNMENLVFTTEHGTPHYDTNIRTDQRSIIAKLRKKGIQIECTFHTLRHCFATRCIENGMSPKVLQAILGHSTFSTTMDLYCDVMESRKRSEMKKIAKAL